MREQGALIILIFMVVVSGRVDVASAGPRTDPTLRKLIPATHPAVQLEGRWLFLPERTSPNFYPTLDRSDPANVAGLARFGARAHHTVMPMRVAFRGSSSVSLHWDRKFRLFTVDWRILPDRPRWNTAEMKANLLLSNRLDPNKTYELQVVHARLNTLAKGLRLLGIGLDMDDAARAVAMPSKNRTFEFIGDSISTVIHATPHTLASIPLVACELLGASCSIIAQAGATLLSYGPSLQPGMLNGYFRRWIPYSSNRALQAPKWDFWRSAVPDGIVINLGTNDRRAVRNNASLESVFVSSYVYLIRGIRREYGTKPIIYVQLPYGGRYARDWSWTEALPRDLFLQIVQACEDPRVKLLDTTGWLDSVDLEEVLRDRIHPSAAGNMYLGKRVAEAVTLMGR